MECATIIHSSEAPRKSEIVVEHLVLGGGSYGWKSVAGAAGNALEVDAAERFVTKQHEELSPDQVDDLYTRSSEEVIARAVDRMQAFVRGCGSRKRLQLLTREMMDLAERCKLEAIKESSVKQKTVVVGDEAALESLAWLTTDEQLAAKRRAAQAHAVNEIRRLSVLSKWIAVRNLLWMAAVGKFIKERQKVKKLFKTEGIFVGSAYEDDPELQPPPQRDSGSSDSTLTSSSTVPYERQGDIEMFSLENLSMRRTLSKNPKVIAAIEQMWNIDDLKAARQKIDPVSGFEQAEEFLCKTAYVDLLVRLQHLIYVHPIDVEAAERNALADWKLDSVPCESGLEPNQEEEVEVGRMVTREAFIAAIFQLIDTWTDTVEEEDYVGTVNRLTKGITHESEEHRIRLLETSKLKSNAWFAQSAKRRYLKFKEFAKSRRKSNINVKISQGQVLSQIGKVYASKRAADLHCDQRKVRYLEFDRFLYNYYLQQYGDKKIAKKSLIKMVNSVMFFAKSNPRVRLFAKLAGIPSEPPVDVVGRFGVEYNPTLASFYFLPLLELLIDHSVYGKLLTCRSSTFCTLNNFLIAVHKVCAHVPRDSKGYINFLTRLADIATPMSDAAEEGKQIVLAAAIGRSPSQRQSIRANLSGKLKHDLNNTIDLKSLQNKCLLPLDDALLLAFDLCEIDYDWRQVLKGHICCKATVQWTRLISKKTNDTTSSCDQSSPPDSTGDNSADTPMPSDPEKVPLLETTQVLASFSPNKLTHRSLRDRLRFMGTPGCHVVLTVKKICNALAGIGLLGDSVAQYLLSESNVAPLDIDKNPEENKETVAVNSARGKLKDAQELDQAINGQQSISTAGVVKVPVQVENQQVEITTQV